MSAPERIYIAEESARVFFDMASPGKQEYIRADIHEAEIEALRANLAASIAVREEMQLGGNKMAESLRFAREEIEALRAENAQLKESRRELDLLYAAGVDNWEGYEDALAEGDES